MAPPFLHLPPEIRTLILCNCTDVPSLLSLIASSPDFLHVYRLNRDFTYKQVVGKQIGEEFLHTAFTVTELRQSLNVSTDVSPLLKTGKRLVCDANGDRTYFPGASMTEVRRMYALHRVIEDLVQGLAQDALDCDRSRVVAQGSAAIRTTVKVNISPSERHRLFRGLYTWELQSLMFQHALCASRNNASIAIQVSDCLVQCLPRTLELYELCEMQFVQCHLEKRLNDFMVQVEDDRMEEFVKRGPGFPRYDWVTERGGKDKFFACASRFVQTDWVMGMLWTQGLTEIHRTLRLPTPRARLSVFLGEDFFRERPVDEETAGEESFRDSKFFANLRDLRRAFPLIRYVGIHYHARFERLFRLEQLEAWKSYDWESPRKEAVQHEETVCGLTFGSLWSLACNHWTPYRIIWLDKFPIPGFAIWDAERLLNMNAFSNASWETWPIIRQFRRTVSERAAEQEQEWKAQGLSPPDEV